MSAGNPSRGKGPAPAAAATSSSGGAAASTAPAAAPTGLAASGGAASRRGHTTLSPKRTLEIYKEPSVQTQLDANDVPEFANEPGPGHYFGPENNGFSSFGNQKFSKCASAPEFNFPRTGWEEWSTVIISKGHEGTLKGRDGPGIKYDPSACAGQGLSQKTTKIGTSLRPDLAVSLGVDPNGSPGPTYNLRDAPGSLRRYPGQQGRKTTLPQAERFVRNPKHGGIGPGQYARKDTSVNLSTGKSFGVGRGAYEKVIRPGWEHDLQCKTSQGVGPPVAERDSAAAFSIGRQERFPPDRAASETPGPGRYDQQTNSVCSDLGTTVNFGRQPRKPRFRPLLATLTSKNGGWGYF